MLRLLADLQLLRDEAAEGMADSNVFQTWLE